MTDPCRLSVGQAAKDEDHRWEIMDGQGDDTHNASSSTSSLGDPTVSNGSASSSSDMADDASSSSTSSSSSSSSQPLYDLSELMAQLPIKRGLSKFYQGKSQSFTSLSRVTSIEELPKKGNPYTRKTKASKSYGGGFDTYKLYTLPKPSITKKTSRGSLLSSSFPNRRGSFLSRCRQPL